MHVQPMPTKTSPLLMIYLLHLLWDDLTADQAEELLARAAAGEPVFCEHLALLTAA